MPFGESFSEMKRMCARRAKPVFLAPIPRPLGSMGCSPRDHLNIHSNIQFFSLHPNGKCDKMRFIRRNCSLPSPMRAFESSVLPPIGCARNARVASPPEDVAREGKTQTFSGVQRPNVLFRKLSRRMSVSVGNGMTFQRVSEDF